MSGPDRRHRWVVIETLQGNKIVAEQQDDGALRWEVNPANFESRVAGSRCVRAAKLERGSMNVRGLQGCHAGLATDQCADYAASLYKSICAEGQRTPPDAVHEERAGAAQLGASSQFDGVPVTFDLEVLRHHDSSSVLPEALEPVDTSFRQYGGRCLLLHNILSPGECEFLIESMNKDLSPVQYRHDYRRNDRCVFESVALADLLWQRVRPFAQGLAIHVDEDPSKQRLLAEPPGECPRELRVGYGFEGDWHPAGLNECLRFCRYDPGGYFRKHCDAPFRRSEDEMSLFTCMFYLNGDMEGGSTRFLHLEQEASRDKEFKLAESSDVLASVAPEPGLCVLFFQPGLLHEGEDLRAGAKYILRTDVMCRRAPGTKPVRSARQLEALELVRQAELAEERTECERAAHLYRRAFRLDPQLERSL